MKKDYATQTLACVTAIALLGVAACGKPTSAVAPASAGSATANANPQNAYGPTSASYNSDYAGGDSRAAPVPMVDGKPMWASNRRHTAEENAQYQFTKNGGDFATRSESDYVRKVHAFIENPPADIQSIERRNGDKLLYDPKDNVFAVVSREGAPRTMFKPRNGAQYWAQQKATLSEPSRNGGASGQDQG